MVDVVHDADYGIAAAARDFDLLTQWFTIRKESSRRSLIDDDDAGASATILSSELPASQKSDAQACGSTRGSPSGSRLGDGLRPSAIRLSHYLERKVVVDTDRIHRQRRDHDPPTGPRGSR